MRSEQWLPIPESLRYELSSRGRVRHGAKVLRLQHSEKGYARITLWCDDGVKRTFRIHVLVARMFIGPKPDGHEVCHNNGAPDDNRRENLRYDTPANNQLDSVRHGTHNNARKTRCKREHQLTSENVYVIPSTGSRQCRQCVRDRVGKSPIGERV